MGQKPTGNEVKKQEDQDLGCMSCAFEPGRCSNNCSLGHTKLVRTYTSDISVVFGSSNVPRSVGN